MRIPLWLLEEKQTVYGTKNRKRKAKIKQRDHRLIADVVTGRFNRIARYQSPVMEPFYP